MTVGRICSREVIVARVTEPLRVAAELMSQQRVGSVVVYDDRPDGGGTGRRVPTGIVADRDIVLAMLRDDGNINGLSIDQAMSRDVVSVREDDGIEDALERMRMYAVRRAPVVDASGALVGLVSTHDLLEVLTGQLDAIVRVIQRQMERHP
jgi:CBS domain-containing protein